MSSEVIEALALEPGNVVIDATLGLGGHAQLLLGAIGPAGKLLGIERTEEGLNAARENLAHFGSQTTLVRADFRHLDAVVRDRGFQSVDGILFDLGLASWQLDSGYQGLSFQTDAPLDMRLSDQTPKDFTSKDEDPSEWTRDAALARLVRTWRFRPAGDFVATASEEELHNALHHLGGVRTSRAVANRIVTARTTHPIETTGQLVTVIDRESPGLLAPVFQALRILVNDEYGALVAGLRAAWTQLRPGGRLAVITFQGDEDRITKRELRALPGSARLQSFRPTDEEIQRNPRSRSATLRVTSKQPTQS